MEERVDNLFECFLKNEQLVIKFYLSYCSNTIEVVRRTN